jgi:hypothetical protein
MVTIPPMPDFTLDALNRAREDEQYKEKRRQYLGASMIGDPCARKIWYEYNNYPRAPLSAVALLAADSGYFAEDITAKRLNAIEGVTLFTKLPDGRQYNFEALQGRFKGHADGIIQGIIQAPKAQHVWEHKDKDHKKFADFQKKKKNHGEKRALQHWDERYFGQAQVLMHYLQIDRHYLTVSYAGARKYDSCRTEYQPEIAARYVDRAEKILEATQEPPRIRDEKDFFLCRFCEFKEVCHA